MCCSNLGWSLGGFSMIALSYHCSFIDNFRSWSSDQYESVGKQYLEILKALLLQCSALELVASSPDVIWMGFVAINSLLAGTDTAQVSGARSHATGSTVVTVRCHPHVALSPHTPARARGWFLVFLLCSWCLAWGRISAICQAKCEWPPLQLLTEQIVMNFESSFSPSIWRFVHTSNVC